MKGTRHNGRSGKNGVYNPLHNDRRFNPEHSEHIDNERVRQIFTGIAIRDIPQWKIREKRIIFF